MKLLQYKIFTSLVVLLNFSLSVYAKTFNSVKDGEWSDPCTWSQNCKGGTPSLNDDVNIYHDVELDVSLTGGNHIKGQLFIADSASLIDASGGSSFSMRIQNNGSFEVEGITTVEGDLEIQGKGELIVRKDATLNVQGNADWSSDANVLVEEDGEINIDGDLDVGNNSDDIVVDGVINVGEDFKTGNGSEISGSGEINIDGQVNNDGVVFDIIGSNADCADCTLPNNALPVDLVYFSVEQKENSVHLNWETSSELNNDFFLVQRSQDAKDWKTLGLVNGHSTTLESQYYSFMDELPSGRVFYRLKQVDFNGQYEYSSIKELGIGGRNEPKIYLQNGAIMIQERGEFEAIARVFSLSGQLLETSSVDGLAKVPISQKLSNSACIVVVVQNGKTTRQKLWVR